MYQIITTNSRWYSNPMKLNSETNPIIEEEVYSPGCSSPTRSLFPISPSRKEPQTPSIMKELIYVFSIPLIGSGPFPAAVPASFQRTTAWCACRLIMTRSLFVWLAREDPFHLILQLLRAIQDFRNNPDPWIQKMPTAAQAQPTVGDQAHGWNVSLRHLDPVV